ncbi:MAG: N-acetylmuramoyl-L-alanine amidase [Erysipelotrichaceae bacterium]
MYLPSYAPPKHKIAWKRIFVMITLILGISVGHYLYQDYNTQISQDSYGICGWNNIDTRKNIENPIYTYEVKDYLFYGETLNLYSEEYQLNVDDYFYGKSLTLVDICSGEKSVYIMDRTIDGQIPLEVLEEGTYAIYLNQDVDMYQLYFSKEMSDTIYTVTRNGENYRIYLFADENRFNDEDEDPFLEENFLYIEVSKEELPEDTYDVIIDAGHSSMDSGWSVDYGYESNGLIESEETYSLAILLKEDLEALGLKVLLTRNEISDVIDSYDLDGRLYLGYMANAKYYFDIQGNGSVGTYYGGTQVIYSSFSSNNLASTIYQTIVNNTSLYASNSYSSTGPVASGLSDGYDGRMMIRESGGRILGAGTFSEASATNAFFNKESRFGMQAITIEYFYLTNPIDVEIWNNEIESIAQATADGFARYLGID